MERADQARPRRPDVGRIAAKRFRNPDESAGEWQNAIRLGGWLFGSAVCDHHCGGKIRPLNSGAHGGANERLAEKGASMFNVRPQRPYERRGTEPGPGPGVPSRWG